MKTDLVCGVAVLSVCVSYGAATSLLWLYQVATPRDWLLERLKDLHVRIDTEQPWAAGRGAQRNLALLRTSIAKPWVLVPTSRVQAGWRHVHSLEDAHVLELPEHVVDEGLAMARTRLDGLSNPVAQGLVKSINEAKGKSLDRKRAVLRNAEIFRHDRNDTTYEDLAGLLAKAVWLTLGALALVVTLAFLFDRESYFLLGAAGALISRLTRVLERRPSASDYGAAFSTLILSPAAGALAGWVGVLTAVVLADDPFNVLDDRFNELWDDATEPLGLFVAFVFGFSERLFNRLLGVAEGQIGRQLPEGEPG